MSNLSVFNFNQNEVRTIVKDDGEIWFVASDVAKVLEYRDASNMIRNLDADESDTHKTGAATWTENCHCRPEQRQGSETVWYQ